jgi:IclR family acetate operon transcriptional repressor
VVETKGETATARVSGSVQSVDRAIDLLEALARSEGPQGIGELAASTGLPQATVHRLLRSMQARGYVRHDSSRKYGLGAAAFLLGDAAQRSFARSARPHLQRLVDLSGETANLAVLEGDDVVYLAQVPSPHTLRMFAEVGRHVPPHSTAVGKVLLAGLAPDRVGGILGRRGMPPMTGRTITAPATFAEELEKVRQQRWAADEQEQEQGIRCVAVPVRNGDRVVAALSLSGPAERFLGADHHRLVEEMADVAAAFSDDLDGVGAS